MTSPSSATSSEAGRNPHGSTAKKLSLIEAHCVLCGSTRFEPEAYGYDFEYNTCSNAFRFVRCSDCEHCYLNPRPSAADLDVIYPDTYYTLSGTTGIVARMQRIWEGRKVRLYQQALGPGPKRILDIGCGDGRFLEVLRHFGPPDWELVGIDFDADAVAKCRARGFQTLQSRVEDLPDQTKPFDAIIMLQLIEHVEDPVLLTRRVHDLLTPAGIFIVETPNLAGLDYRLFRGRHWGHYHIPRHWNLFSTGSLQRMLRGAGFEIDRTDQLISTSAWTISLHNYFLDIGLPRGFVFFFSYKNPLLLALFVLVDNTRVLLGRRTSNQRVIGRRARRASELSP